MLKIEYGYKDVNLEKIMEELVSGSYSKLEHDDERIPTVHKAFPNILASLSRNGNQKKEINFYELFT